MKNRNRVLFSPSYSWVKYLSGISLGIYLAVFLKLLQFDSLALNSLSQWNWLLLFVVVGLITAFCSHGVSRWFLQKYCGKDKASAIRSAALVDLSWVLLPAGVLFYPFMEQIGATLQMDVLGKVYMILTNRFIQLTPSMYLYLLWAGPWVLLSVFLKVIYGVHYYVAFHIKNRKDLKVSLAKLFLIAVVFYGLLGTWATSLYPPTGDEPHYLLITESLIQDHDIDLQNNMRNKDYQKFYPSQTLDFHGIGLLEKPGISKHFPALAVLLVPLYLLLGLGGAVLSMVLIAAGITICLYQLSRQWGQSQADALLVWLLALVSMPMGVYFNLIYPELPATFLFLLALLAWHKGGKIGLWGVVMAVAILPWLYPKYIPLALVLFFLSLRIPGVDIRNRFIPYFLLVISGVFYMLFYFKFYGFGISANPYGNLVFPVSWQGLRNTTGLLVDRDFGIVATAPIFLLSFLGWQYMWNKQNKVAIVLAIVFMMQFLFYTVFDDFTGSAAVFSRQMLISCLPLLPFVIIGWNQVRKCGRGIKAIGVFCLGYSMFVAWISTAWPFLRYLSPKLLLWEKLGFAPALFPSLIVDPGGKEIFWASIWILFIGIYLWKVVKCRVEKDL